MDAQSNKSIIYNAFVSGNMQKWKNTMDNMAQDKQLSNEQQLELIGYYYGYIGYNLGVKNEKNAQVYIDKGEDIINKLFNNNFLIADVYAYKGAFVGFKIAISPYKAPFIGKSSIDNVKKAIAIDPNNIQANIERANVLYYSPSAFGGNKTEAKLFYTKAINLFEKDTALKAQNWLYLSLLTNVATIYTEEKNYKEAKHIYDKILKIEPNYQYVKEKLLPDLLKKM
jgi:tetratricopeptide (TPR) repeat protein